MIGNSPFAVYEASLTADMIIRESFVQIEQLSKQFICNDYPSIYPIPETQCSKCKLKFI